MIDPLYGYGRFLEDKSGISGNKNFPDSLLHYDASTGDTSFYYEASSVIESEYNLTPATATHYIPAVDDTSALRKSKIVHLFQDMAEANYWLPDGREIIVGVGDTSVYTVRTDQGGPSGSTHPTPPNPGLGPMSYWSWVDVWGERYDYAWGQDVKGWGATEWKRSGQYLTFTLDQRSATTLDWSEIKATKCIAVYRITMITNAYTQTQVDYGMFKPMDCTKVSNIQYRVSLSDINQGANEVSGFANRLLCEGASYSFSGSSSYGTICLAVSFIPIFHLEGVDFSELGPF